MNVTLLGQRMAIKTFQRSKEFQVTFINYKILRRVYRMFNKKKGCEGTLKKDRNDNVNKASLHNLYTG